MSWKNRIPVALALLLILIFAGVALAEGATIVVNTTSDVADFGGAQTVADLPGPDQLVSLREAITAANNTAGANIIAFNIPTTDPGFSIAGFTGQFVIFVEGDPLIVTDNATTIDGRTQTAFTGDTNPSGSEIHLRTTPPYMNMSGLYLNSDNNMVVGLDGFGLFRYGIEINGTSNLISGNGIRALGAGVYIAGSHNTVGGTTPEAMNRILGGTTGVWIAGAAAAGNLVQGNLIWRNNSYGVAIDYGASSNTVGGATAAARNIIHSNGHLSGEGSPVGADVRVTSINNVVQGNYIGVDANGAQAAGGSVWSGVELSGSFNSIKGNVISGHTGPYSKLTARPAGIRLDGGMNNRIEGNFIGTDASGTKPLPNEYGIAVQTWNYSDVPRNSTIAGNTIAFNVYDAVAIGGNTIRLSGNSIFRNGELGINLAPDPYTQQYPNTVTPNDLGDVDTGANNLQNFPVITSTSSDATSTVVRGTIDTQNPQAIKVELFSNDAADSSGFGEGQRFVGSAVPDAGGNWIATLSGGLTGKFITATATDAAGNTSEFSRAVLAGSGQSNQPPVAVASANPQSGIAPLIVYFTSSGSFDPDGSIVAYKWNFGDGSTSTLANPSHSFGSAGSYLAKLTVTDNVGSADGAGLTITVNSPIALRSTKIALTETLTDNRVTVTGRIPVKNANGVHVPAAMVTVQWTRPNGNFIDRSAITNLNGIARFSIKGGRGTYILRVTNITKSGYWFDSASSTLSQSITK